jgi:16S rRNA (guanine1516-N2)-methyltransferase
MSSLAIVYHGDKPAAAELALQTRLACALIPGSSDDYDFLLQFSQGHLSLLSTRADAPGELWVDFADAALSRRRQQGVKNQELGKAVGLKKHQGQSILDATAGLGGDAFLLASAGCQVKLLERSPVVSALLADGLGRALQGGGELAEIVQRMELRAADFLQLQDLEPVDVVYLDPMFPKDRKTARSKKAMFLLQELLPEPQEGAALLDKAMTLARRRVVVKRGRHSPLMDSSKPDIQYRGSSSRFDVYLMG